MNTLKKSLAFALAASLCCTAVGCNKEEEIPTVAGDEIVMNVGSYAITADEYNYYFLNQKYSYDNGDSAYWTSDGEDSEALKEYSDILKEYTNASLMETYTVAKMCDDAGLLITDELLAQIDNDIKELTVLYGGEETFNQMLETSNLTLETYRNMAVENMRTSMLFEHVMADKLRANAEESYLRAAHILIMPDETAVDQAAAKKEAFAKAEEVLAMAVGGEDFFKLVDEYNEDPGMMNNRDGYYFTEGDMVTPFYEGAIALKDYEISGIVETDYGFHIIQRLPMEQEYIDANLMEFAADDDYTTFYDEVAKVQETMEYTTTEAYEKITLENTIKLEAAAAEEAEG